MQNTNQFYYNTSSSEPIRTELKHTHISAFSWNTSAWYSDVKWLSSYFPLYLQKVNKLFLFELKLYPYFTFCYFFICSKRFAYFAVLCVAYFTVLCVSWTKGARALPLDNSVALLGNVLNIMKEIHKITRSIESCRTFLYFKLKHYIWISQPAG